MYSQIESVVMGSPLGSILANIFMSFYEDWLFENVHRLTMYYQYIDDTYALFDN